MPKFFPSRPARESMPCYGSVLPAEFYRRPADALARDLLGKILVVGGLDSPRTAGFLVEVEAYLGADDAASHAFRGPSRRNRSMFDVGGTCYVYLSYGINYCMNVVAHDKGVGQAVLLRAIEPIEGMKHMAQRRGMDSALLSETQRSSARLLRNLTNGPGKLTQAFGIGPADDGRQFCEPTLMILEPTLPRTPERIVAAPRIGISKAKDRPLRFYFADSPWLSRPHRETTQN